MKYLRQHGSIVIPVVLLITLLLPLLLRAGAGAPITPGASSYALLSQAESFVHGGVLTNPYEFLLVGMDAIGVPWLLPLLIAVCMFYLLNTYLMRVTRNMTVTILSLVFLAVMPAISVLGTYHAPTLLGISFLLGGLLTVKRSKWVGALLYFLAFITTPFQTAVVLLYFIITKKKARQERIASIAAIVAGVLVLFVWMGSIPLPTLTWDLFAAGNPIFEFGNPVGLSIFLLILASYGLLRKRLRSWSEIPAALVVVSLFVHELIPLTTIVLVVIASYGIVELVRNKWELDLLRQMLTVLILCIGLFLLIVTIRERLDDNPTQELTNTLVYLQNQHREGDVLTLPSYSPLVEYFAKKNATPVLGPTLFNNRDADKLYTYLERTQTSHVLITEEMTTTLFDRSDEGILFLLPNTERFVLVYQTSESTLWYYIPRR